MIIFHYSFLVPTSMYIHFPKAHTYINRSALPCYLYAHKLLIYLLCILTANICYLNETLINFNQTNLLCSTYSYKILYSSKRIIKVVKFNYNKKRLARNRKGLSLQPFKCLNIFCPL